MDASGNISPWLLSHDVFHTLTMAVKCSSCQVYLKIKSHYVPSFTQNCAKVRGSKLSPPSCQPELWIRLLDWYLSFNSRNWSVNVKLSVSRDKFPLSWSAGLWAVLVCRVCEQSKLKWGIWYADLAILIIKWNNAWTIFDWRIFMMIVHLHMEEQTKQDNVLVHCTSMARKKYVSFPVIFLNYPWHTISIWLKRGKLQVACREAGWRCIC